MRNPCTHQERFCDGLCRAHHSALARMLYRHVLFLFYTIHHILLGFCTLLMNYCYVLIFRFSKNPPNKPGTALMVADADQLRREAKRLLVLNLTFISVIGPDWTICLPWLLHNTCGEKGTDHLVRRQKASGTTPCREAWGGFPAWNPGAASQCMLSWMSPWPDSV